jgi:hypothetical protein
MASTKTYLLVPHHDFPADGPIVLGSIILDPREPGESLNEAEIPEIPIKYPSHKYNWEQTVESMRNCNAGVWARCVEYVGWSGSLGMGFDTVIVDHYKFAHLETTFFTPSQEYIEGAVKTPKIRSFLEGARYAPVYMITGLKIVHGPGSHVISRRAMTQGGHANIGLSGFRDAGSSAVDSGDASIRQGGTTSTNFSYNGSSDFVIGYRLGKITFQRGWWSGKGPHPPKYQRNVAGNMLGVSERRTNEDFHSSNAVKVIYEGEEAIAEELREQNLASIAAIDEGDDEDCQCFVVSPPGTDHNEKILN